MQHGAQKKRPGEDMPALWIIGTGGHARVLLDLARDCGHPVQGFIDPAPNGASARASASEPVAPFGTDLAVLDGLGALRELHAPKVVIAIGGNALRRETTAEATALGAKAVTLIHPSARVEPSATIGAGAQVCVGAIVNAAATIARGALINSGAIIEHECEIGEFAHICPGVAMGGRVRVGAGAMIGIGSSVIQGVTIGAGATVGAGAVVLGDVEAGETVVGVPARVVGQ